MMPRCALRSATAAALLIIAVSPASARQPTLQSHAERTGWTGLTPHDSVVSFYRALAAASPDVRVAEAGRSRENRPLLLVTLAQPAVTQPWEAHASGKPIVFVSAQVHGDEPAGKEGLMVFARDLVQGPLRPLLERVIFVLVPQVNPDGAEAGEWGTRANAAGYNINRDYLRLVNPETRALVAAIAAWRPHIVIDAHELTGPRIDDFYTLHPTSLNAPDEVVALAAGPLTDAVRNTVEGAGFSWFPYHIQPTDPNRIAEIGLQAAEYGGRTLRGYGGEQAAVTLLFESKRDHTSPDARVDIGPRARAHRAALEAVGRFAADSAGTLLRTVRAAREQMRQRGAMWSAEDSIVIRARAAERIVVDYRMPDLRRSDSVRGWEPTGTERIIRVPLRDTAVATLTRVRPVAYLIEEQYSSLARQLAIHGLTVERITEDADVPVETFRVDSVGVADEAYEGYLPLSVRTTTLPRTMQARAGAWIVRTDQPNAAILFSLLEPESVDSFATIGALGAALLVGELLPVHRVVETGALQVEAVQARIPTK